jgi:hypothetical protein
VTIRAPATPDVPALEAAPPAATAAVATQALAGVVVGGTPSGDVIVMSRQALALLRAARPIVAFIINGMETMRQTIALGAGRTLRLESGIYRLA